MKRHAQSQDREASRSNDATESQDKNGIGRESSEAARKPAETRTAYPSIEFGDDLAR